MSESRAKIYKSSDFSEGAWHETLVTLGKHGFSPEMAEQTKNSKTGMAKKIVELFAQGVPLPSELLELIGTVTTPATTENFIASEHFIVNTKKGAPVKISYLSENFEKWFLGKNEVPVAEAVLRYHKLLKNSVDAPIISELGGESEVERSLSQMFSLMERQTSGENILLTNGYANIFYIKDITGVLRAVFCGWDGVGWIVDASSVAGPGGWNADDRVFSRSSLES